MSANDDVGRSQHLSLVLRHRPDAVGIALDEHGWVDVTTLLDALGGHGTALSRDDLDRIVVESDKQRFEWDVAADRIRARQGHSVQVDLALEPADPPARLFHGTPVRNLASIRAAGLEPRQRHHVHLSAQVETARQVGARRGEHVVLVADAARMSADGHVFLVTGNGVWLTDHVPPAYLSELPPDDEATSERG